ncbi:MAG TPA: bifunctional phosphopantothenoylcysteine decarboxylase/phosphopantothenate--cysteine ligase CoaBC [Negativicutes bacterium]|nr:bifunctional phosphopantothenoylcysteine decarboxylase/phosphopantothenate--cysteine ligase CoaBC [Negativicutes bacterium]
MLEGKTIVAGVTGGIAAYKAADLASRLRKQGADLHVIMTRSATEFIQPLTFREITGNPVIVSMWDEPKRWSVQHIGLARKADLFVIVPATANVLGKISHGIADDMLTTTVMATTAPVLFVPAMNSAMYLNPIVQDNIKRLKAYGYLFMEPVAGPLACGESGIGRLPEPADIAEYIGQCLAEDQTLAGKKILITAAGTQEPIDPVRYIGNRASGKMGYALAEAAKNKGASVVLVSGPTHLAPPAGVELIAVNTAGEMRDAVMSRFPELDVVIKTAAVADYRPKVTTEQKIKKAAGELVLTLEKTPDILRELGQQKQHQILVGFAAETENLLEHGRDKLYRKNLDMLVVNDVTAAGAGFATDTNIVNIMFPDGTVEEWPIMTKKRVAEKLLGKIIELMQKKS